jgi:Nuclease-related domain
MKPTTKILIGGPLKNDEASFLRVLCADLSSNDLLILANFLVRDRQIDFLVVTPTGAALIELKHFSRPMFGDRNGDWTICDAAGKRVPTSNGFQQTLSQVYALSDEMRDHAKRSKNVPAPSKGAFYSNFRAFMSIYPELHIDSALTRGDRKVLVDSYPNVLDSIRTGQSSPWTMSDWSTFATEQLHLTEASLEAATDTNSLTGQNELDGYRIRLSAFLTTGLAPMLAPSDEHAYGEGIVTHLCGPNNYLLFGPSGSAKTFHLHHFAFQRCHSGAEVPVFIDSKRYGGGDFWPLLRQSIAPFFTGEPRHLLHAIRHAGLRPVLLVDALNECPTAIQVDLLKGVQAFAIHYDARVIVTAHDGPTELGGLTLTPLPIHLPKKDQKRQIYAFHAGFPPNETLDQYCAEFTNAYDLSVAGRCHRNGSQPHSRLELYDRYIDVCLPSQHRVVASALLRAIAADMSDSLCTTLSRERCETLATRFLETSDAPLRIVDDIFDSPLVEVSAETFSFEHELLLTYFRSEHLRRLHHPIDALAHALRKPRNEPLIEFILPRFKRPDEVITLLGAIDNFSTLRAIAQGQYGSHACVGLQHLCERFVSNALRDLRNLRIDFVVADSEARRRSIGYVWIEGAFNWTPHDAHLCEVLPYLPPESRMQERILALLDATERYLKEALYATADNSSLKRRAVWSQAYHQLGGISGSKLMQLPYSKLLSALGHVLSSGKQTDAGTSAPTHSQLQQLIQNHSPSSYAFFLLLHDHAAQQDVDLIEENLEVVEMALAHEVDSIQLMALHYLHCMRYTVEQTGSRHLPRITRLLDSASHSNNVIWNSLIAEIQASYGLLEPIIEVADVIKQMQALLSPSDESAATFNDVKEFSELSEAALRADLARGLVNSFFEDIFQGVYYEAYTTLSSPQKQQLLTLAAQSTEGGLNMDWILGELLPLGDDASLPVFQRYAGSVNTKSSFLQQEVSTFVLGIRGCALWSLLPPEYYGDGSVFDEPWGVISGYLYRAYRTRIDASAHLPLSNAFHELKGQARLAAGVCLYNLHRSSWSRESKKDAPIDLLLTQYPADVLSIAHYCLENRQLITTLTIFDSEDEVSQYLLQVLSKIGNATSTEIVVGLVDDPTIGKFAVSALKMLRERHSTD